MEKKINKNEDEKEIKKEDKTEAKKIKIIIDGEEKEAEHRVFKSGRKGYGCYGIIKVGGYPHRLSLNLIEMEKNKVCNFCQEMINLNSEKHTLLGTYNGDMVMDENYFHFECFRKWYNHKLKEKMQNTLQDASKKLMGALGNVNGSVTVK